MEALDLKKFGWVKDHENFKILAITSFLGTDVAVVQANEGGKITLYTVDEFCRTFTATYSVAGTNSFVDFPV
ncbi:MAG: hypothetical protein EOO61_04485 [Hymenobacter sp.]|nr:MAG: hypothetical protein EOO61_04485 [Hymenobacter sp.]